MRTYTALGFVFLAIGLSASCDDDGDYATACEHYADVFCTKLSACYPSFDNVLGEPGVCAERYARSCEAGMQLDGVLATPSDLDTCATAFEEATCGELTSALSVQCLPMLKGERPDGASCAAGLQCQGGECLIENGECGVCVTYPAEGEPCEDRCQLGLMCGADKTCTQFNFNGLNEPCGTVELGFCSQEYTCIGGVCSERKGQGEPCSSGECALDLECDSATNTCESAPAPAAVGEACGGAIQCAFDGYCEEGVCLAKVADGESCTEDLQCLVAAHCDGTCTFEPPVCD